MQILGIHHGHDSSACLIEDGEIVADAAEERFTRLKHCNDVPRHAMKYCLSEGGLSSINDVDRVAISWSKPTAGLKTLMCLRQDVGRFRKMAKIITGHLGLPFESREGLPVYLRDFILDDPSKLTLVEHHLAHAASAHFTRADGSRCLVFTVDGAGESVSTAVWMAQGTEIKPLQKLYREAAIGWAYSLVTEALQWWHGDGEGKTMGLAPYGDPNVCYKEVSILFPEFEGTEVSKPSDFSLPLRWKERSATHFHISEAQGVMELIDTYGRENVAAAAQRKLEEVISAYIKEWVKETGCSRTAYSGGVFLNVKLNQRIWEMRCDLLTEQHIFPNCGDSGLALGAALWAYYREAPFEGFSLDHLYWGPEFSNEEIEKTLKAFKIDFEKCENPCRRAAELLADNRIIAWFQGRMESGPRALGNRSILMSPLRGENKDVLNAEVKFREAFRPFCPSLLEEYVDEYIKDPRPERFMITSFDVTDSKKETVPAVVHVDGTLRPHTVKKDMNPRYWDLINEFGKLTGEYIVLNTSFNVMGEPIICTPAEAVRCFFSNGLDHLFLGNYLVSKRKSDKRIED